MHRVGFPSSAFVQKLRGGDSGSSANNRGLQRAASDDALPLDSLAALAGRYADLRSLRKRGSAVRDGTKIRGQSALFSLIGHKGDLMLVHFRKSFADLNQAELKLANLRLSDYLEPTSSYLSIIELGLYDSTLKIYKELDRRKAFSRTPTNGRRDRVQARAPSRSHASAAIPEIPPNRYVCFYPMDRRRGEDKNWYTLPIEERARQMNEHGLVGRRYAGEVKQIITGSIGFDDWEWGVDLFADDPLVFKKLIYEMRFDHVSAVYALFGQFYVGVRCPAARWRNC
jgi:hydrogen peroxide-dependent heme synthase